MSSCNMQFPQVGRSAWHSKLSEWAVCDPYFPLQHDITGLYCVQFSHVIYHCVANFVHFNMSIITDTKYLSYYLIKSFKVTKHLWKSLMHTQLSMAHKFWIELLEMCFCLSIFIKISLVNSFGYVTDLFKRLSVKPTAVPILAHCGWRFVIHIVRQKSIKYVIFN